MLKFNPKELSCTWWALPKSIQKQLQKLTFGIQKWTFKCYKNADGSWGFNIPYLLTFNEKFINGTDKDLDWWFKHLNSKDAVTGDKIKMTISSEPLKDYTTVIEYLGDDNWGQDYSDSMLWASFYVDKTNDNTIWLCQYLQFLFGSKPPVMYLKLK
jgi:hypothetical protein